MKDISNYGDLKTAVQTWLNRKDSSTVDNIPAFINFAEKQFTRLVRLPHYETAMSTLWTSTTSYVMIPTDLLSIKHAFIGTRKLSRVDIGNFLQLKEKHAGETDPRYFCRVGNTVQIFPEPTVGDTVIIIYNKDIPEMSNDTDCPYSLETAPEIMLYLALRHAAIFIRDNEQEQYWMSKATEAADSLNQLLDEVEWSGSPLVVEQFDSYTNSKFNNL